VEERIMAGYYDRDRNQRSADGSIYTAPTAAGTMNHAYSHHMNANEYIASGMPFVHRASFLKAAYTEDGSSGNYFDELITITFPYVTRWLMVQVHDGTLTNGQYDLINVARIGFGNYDTDEGIQGSNFVTTNITNQQRLELKCKKLYVWLPGTLQGSQDAYIEVIAGLTNVKDFPDQDTRYVSGLTSSLKEGSTTASNGTVTATAFVVSDADTLTTKEGGS